MASSSSHRSDGAIGDAAKRGLAAPIGWPRGHGSRVANAFRPAHRGQPTRDFSGTFWDPFRPAVRTAGTKVADLLGVSHADDGSRTRDLRLENEAPRVAARRRPGSAAFLLPRSRPLGRRAVAAPPRRAA